jgi:ribonuclease Z
VTSVTFLGTGNFQAPPGRYWNSFVMDRTVLVEPAPTALPHLRRCGFPVSDIEVVVISHFHPDHTFGWPFLMLELLYQPRDLPLHVVGPPGVDGFLAEMMGLGGVANVHDAVHALRDVRYVEVDRSWQEAGSLRFRAIQVEHVPHLECFGFVFDRGDRMVGYSGDTRPCPGLDELVGACDVVVLECNGPHPPPQVHMDTPDVKALRERFPTARFVFTHMGEGVDDAGIADVIVPQDFETVEL